MRQLVEKLQSQKTCQKKLTVLKNDREELMAEIIEAQNEEKPTAGLQKKLNDLDQNLEIATRRYELAKSQAYGVAEGLIDRRIEKYSEDSEKYQNMRKDFQEKTGVCLADAVHFLTELGEMDFVKNINSLFLDPLSRPRDETMPIFDSFKRKNRDAQGQGEKLLTLRQDLQQIEMIQKSLAPKSMLVHRLIKQASQELK